MNLQPPHTNVVYDSFDILFKVVNTHAAIEGFALAIKRSKKLKKGILCKVWLECDKSGSYKAKGHGVRQTSTMKDECPCEVIATCHSEQNTWTIEIKCGDHNIHQHLPELMPLIEEQQ